jgi:hypothetical protein
MSSKRRSGKNIVIKEELLPNPYARVQEECLSRFNEKNNEYGDAMNHYGLIGVLMKLEEKIKQSIHVSKSGIDIVPSDHLRDTLISLSNHTTMAIILLDQGKLVSSGPTINEINESDSDLKESNHSDSNDSDSNELKESLLKDEEENQCIMM